LGWGSLLAIISGLASLALLTCAASIAREDERSERALLVRLYAQGGFGAMAVFGFSVLIHFLAEVMVALR